MDSSTTFESQKGRGDCQEGGGSTFLQNSTLVEQLTEAVLKRIDSKAVPLVNPRWPNYERAEPTVVTVEASNTNPPIHFSTPITETDMNDTFDEQALLKKVPKPFKEKAKTLLKTFDERPNELTWDASGHIYIDEKVIPNCNIFELFPSLFRKKIAKNQDGMLDFLGKISSMGLTHLIRADISSFPKETKPTVPATSLTSTTPNWWYIGE